MSESKTSRIPSFYRFYFKTSDPAVLIWAAYMDFFTPDVVYNAYVPSSIAPRNPYHDFLVQQLGGVSLTYAFLCAALLRYTEDINVWKIMQVASLIWDIAFLFSSYSALSRQGRLSLEAMRWEDWADIIITFQAAVVRVLFLLGIGLGRSKAVKRA